MEALNHGQALRSALAICLLSSIATRVQAAFIPIDNHSFESQVLSDGGATVNAIAGWPFITPGVGVTNPDSSESIGGAVPDGQNAAYINHGGIFFQTLSATLDSNTQYTLSLFVARTGLAAPLVAGYVVQLLAGSTVLAEDNSQVNPFPGLVLIPPPAIFLPTSISYTSGANDPLAGQALTIQLYSYGDFSTRTLFDDVRLEATPLGGPNPVPEPSSLALAGVAALGLLKARRRDRSPAHHS